MIGLLYLILIAVGVTIIVPIALVVLAKLAKMVGLDAKGGPSTPEETAACKENENFRNRAAYQAELIARASKRPDGKVTGYDQFVTRSRHNPDK